MCCPTFQLFGEEKKIEAKQMQVRYTDGCIIQT